MLEWLNGLPRFKGRVAAFSSWALLPWILNEPRSRIPSMGGRLIRDADTDAARMVNELTAGLPQYWAESTLMRRLLSARLNTCAGNAGALYVMFEETDEWAHGRRMTCISMARFVAMDSSNDYGRRRNRCLGTGAGRRL